MINKIYLDMDGVLSDFEGRYFSLFDKERKDVRSAKESNPNWTKFVHTEQFKTLDFAPDAVKFLKFIEEVHALGVEVEILSSSGGKKHHEEVASQKVYWLCKRNIPYFANIVSGRKLKSNYATPEAILVDDTKDVIDAFNQAGGHGILHRNVDDTIKQIKSLLNIY